MLLRSFVLSIIALSLTACNISGLGEKGPFKSGSTVTISKLDDQANPLSGVSVNTQTKTKQGFYSVNSVKWSGWTEVQVTGVYFDEYSNSDSTASITLNAITKKDRTFDIANVNLFTHLASARIKQQVANGKTTQAAWKSTQRDLKQIFGLKRLGRSIHRGAEHLSLTRGSGAFRKDNANLLLFTGSFLATGGNATSLQILSDDFADDGQFNGVGESTFNAIASKASAEGLLTTLSQNLKNHGARNPPNNGDMPELPIWVNTDGGGVTDTTAPVITLDNPSTVTVEVNTNYTDAGASALDDQDGVITVLADLSNVDTSIVDANFQIIYTASDNAGNTATESRTVTVVDTTPPVISVAGGDVTILQGSTYNDEGATATDNSNLVVTITTENPVDTTTPNTYTVIYTATDTKGNSDTATRSVTVILPPDTTAPVITLNAIDGVEDVTVEVNTTYTDLGATALDDRDGSVSVQTNLSDVDTSVLDGIYLVTYTATDLAGNSATETRAVTIVDTTPPTISLNGGDVIITEGNAYSDAGVTTSDNSNLAVTVNTNNPVDVNTPDVYTITYTATDTKGNSATATRSVTVEQQAIATTEITGIIKTIDGGPISGANVQAYKNGVLQSQQIIISNGSGNYSISLESGESYTIVAQQFGYANQVVPVNNLTGASLSLDIVLLSIQLDQPIDSTVGDTVTDNAGSAVTWQSGGFDDDSLQLSITSIDTSDANERNLIPGDLVNPFKLFFLGLTEFTFINSNNEEVNLASGKTAEITIPIFQNRKIDGSQYAIGDPVQLYYLNEDTGKWEQDGIAIVVESNAPSGLSAKGTVSHFSWWALSYPSNPAIAGSYASEDLTFDTALSSDGQRAYVADDSAGIKILNISNPSSIALLGSFNTASLFYSHVQLSSDESKLFALSTNAAATIIQIEILDISNPSNIISLVTIPVSGFTTFEVSSDDTKIFIASRDHKFKVIDITTPSNPTLLSSIDSVSVSGHVMDIAISTDGNTAFIAYRVDGLVIVDLTNLNNISVISKTSAGFAMGVAISSDSNRAYVTDVNKKLRIFDTSNRSNPTELGIVNLTDQGRDVVISSTEAYAYVASWESGLQVIDISNSNNPILIGNVNTIGRSINLAISLDDKHVYISDWEGGLQIIDTEKTLLGDSIPPTITLNGSSNINQPLGTPYVELGATAVDDIDGVVTVAITGTVDVSVLGSFHEVTYTATDSSGNESTTHRTIFIVQGPETGHTVIDAVSGLEIQDNEAVTSSMGRTWSEAIDYCENLVLNNLDDWRLPNETDSNDIIVRGHTHAFSGDQIENFYGWKLGVGFTGAPNRSQYWTSFEDNTDTTKAFSIWNDDGVFGFSSSKSLRMGTRCVRN